MRDEDSARVQFEEPYRKTTYVAHDGEARIALRVGDRSPAALDRLLEEHGATEWAYITAWNPYSEPTPAKQNEEAQERLRETLRRERVVFREGMSEPDDGSAGEGSLLALLDHERAESLGRVFGQNAIVVGGVGRAVALLWCLPRQG